jgi:hypothetical protein
MAKRVLPQDWFRILSDPDPPELERMMRVGQLVTWPKVSLSPQDCSLYYQLLSTIS